MALSDEKKREMLLQSFNTLKNNLRDNSDKISELIGKMAKFDLKVAIDMWIYILENGKIYVKDSDRAYNFCGRVAYAIEENIGEDSVIEIVRSNEFIRKNLFNLSGDVNYTISYMVKAFIIKNELNLVNETLNSIYNNKFKSRSLEELLEEIYDLNADEYKLSSEMVELLVYWLDKVKDEVAKARITVTLTDHF